MIMRSRNERFEAQTRPLEEHPPADHASQDHYLAGVVEFMAGIHNWTKRNEVGPNWKCDSYNLRAGETMTILGNNPQRKRMLLWIDSDAAGPVWVSNVSMNDDPAGRNRSGAVRVIPGGPQIEMHHCGAMFARGADGNAAVTTLRLYAEYLRA